MLESIDADADVVRVKKRLSAAEGCLTGSMSCSGNFLSMSLSESLSLSFPLSFSLSLSLSPSPLQAEPMPVIYPYATPCTASRVRAGKSARPHPCDSPDGWAGLGWVPT